MQQQITINNPCNENWDAMIPNSQGKHCNQCSKTVIDFTAWHQNDIFNYLNKNANNKICGRFTQTQLEEKLPTAEQFVKQISYFRIDDIKKVAAIFLFVFALAGTSCNEHSTNGAIEITQIDTTKQETINTVNLLGDTTLAPIIDTIQKPLKGKIEIPKRKKIVTVCEHPEVMGEVAMPEIEPIKELDVVKPEPKIMGDIAVENIPIVKEHLRPEIMGKIAIKPIPKTDSINIKK
jgi:hypothetical protein